MTIVSPGRAAVPTGPATRNVAETRHRPTADARRQSLTSTVVTTDPPQPALTDEQYHAIYEGLYARAGTDLAAVPWAALRPHPSLVDFLQSHPPTAPGSRALVVGCGLGDDAECAAAHGYAVTAFDFSSTAIRRAAERFPDSAVDYRVADLLDLPEIWRSAFDAVVEIRTLQSMPAERRPAAVTAIAATLAPGGSLLLHTFQAEQDEHFDGPPWPVTEGQLAGFTDAGLVRTEHRTEPLTRSRSPLGPSPRALSLTAVYHRPATS